MKGSQAMKIIKKSPEQRIKNQQVNEPGRYFDGQKGWLPIVGYRREEAKQEQRKGRFSS